MVMPMEKRWGLVCFLEDGPAEKIVLHHSKVAIRHHDVTQAPAHADTARRFPQNSDDPDFNSVLTFS